MYLELLKDKEPEVRSEAISKVSELSRYASESAILDHLMPVISNLAKDPSQHVRGSLAHSICEITKYMPQEQALE